MRTRPKLSLIIPTLKRPKSLGYLLESLREQNLAKDDFEVIVISNLNDPATKKQIEKFKNELNLYYFVRGELGVNKARNLGLAQATGKVLLFLDDDCEALDQNFLQSHINLHENYPEFDGIGGPYANGPKTSALGRVYNLNSRVWLENSLLNAPRSLNLIGGNSSYKSKVFNGRRHFDENILFGGSESELNHRLCQEGLRLAYFKDLQIAHHPPIGILAFCRKAFMQGLGSVEKNILQSNVPTESDQLAKRDKFYLWLYSVFFQTGLHLKIGPKVRAPRQIKVLGSLFKALTQPLQDGLARIGIKTYHFQRLHSWKLLMPLKKPLHWLHLNLWKLKIPFHWLKLNLWKLKVRALKPFYFLDFQYRKRVRPLFGRFIENENQGRPNS